MPASLFLYLVPYMHHFFEVEYTSAENAIWYKYDILFGANLASK